MSWHIGCAGSEQGRNIVAEDVAHYQRIVVALTETIRLMEEIDEVIGEHGGWPIEWVNRVKEDLLMPVASKKYPTKYRGSKEYLLVYCELIRAARYKGMTTYQAIADIMGLRLRGSYMGAEVGHMIGEISLDELDHGRPMLSTIVVGVRGSPGAGFFDLARERGKLQDDSKEGEQRFWEGEKKAVYATWQREFKS